MNAKSGRSRQKQRTRDAILDGARKLIAEGEPVTVAAAAAVHGVSRATAYRYFSEPQGLIVEAGLSSLLPAYEDVVAGSTDLRARLRAIVRAMIRLALEHEPTFRAYLAHAVTAPEASRSRGARRVAYLSRALQEAPAPPGKAAQAELVARLSVLAGIEAVIALKDVAGLDDAAVEATCLDMADAIMARYLD